MISAARRSACSAALLVLVAALLASCGRREAAPRVVDGVAYGTTRAPFRGRWWQHYERGVSWSLGGFWAEAEADFRACLRQRATDSRRARTYGMHFVQCFAHRELGAVLLERGALEEAEREVRLSLAQEPSAKAEYLLERILALRAGRPAPPTPAAAVAPTITVDLLASAEAEAGAGAVAVTGAVAGGVPLEAVAEDGSVRTLAVAARGAFAAVLRKGERLRAGSGDQAVVVVPVPPAAPALRLDGPGDGREISEARAVYRFDASAGDGIAEVVVQDGSGRVIAREPADGPQRAGMLVVPLEPGEHRLRFIASDRAGRSAVVERTVVARPRPDQDRALRAAALVLPLQAPVDGAGLGTDDDLLLLTALTQDARFRLLDRQADELLRAELRLVEAGYVDAATAASAGRRLQARYALAGTLRRGRQDIECFVRIVHVETGEEVARADAYTPVADPAQERAFFAIVAQRLRQAFPVLAGRLLPPTGDAPAIDIGALQGVVARMRFHLVARGPELLAADGTLLANGAVRSEGIVETVEVAPTRSRVMLVAGTPAAAGEVVSE